MVRFDGFLSRVPYSNESKGFGGSCQHPNDKESSKPGDKSVTIDLKNGPDDDFEDDYNKAIVQKIIVLVLKSVALTTREARYVQFYYPPSCVFNPT